MLVQDVFDGELKEVIEPLYTEKVWSAIDDDLKSTMKETLVNALLASDMPVEFKMSKIHSNLFPLF